MLFILPLWRDKTYKLYFNKQQDKSHIARDVKSFHAHLPKRRQSLFPAALSDYWEIISLSTISLITQSPLHTPECYAFFPFILRRLRLWLLWLPASVSFVQCAFRSVPVPDWRCRQGKRCACGLWEDGCMYKCRCPKCRLRVLVRPAR